MTNKNDKVSRKMIEGIDKPVSKIFFGTAINSMLKGERVFDLLDKVYSLGINAFDCARGYGQAERVLGEWVNERKIRDKVVILSKCGNVDDKGEVNINREAILKELNESLKELNTDYIDIYLLHRDDPKTSISEIINTLNEIKEEGKIKIFGVSNWTVDRIIEANNYAKENYLEGFSVSSPFYSLANQVEDPWGGNCVSITGDSNKEARDWYMNNQMPVIAYSSLGRGFFSGKFKSYDYEEAKRVLDDAGQKGYLYPENMEKLKRAEELAEKLETNVADIAVRYVFSSDMNIFAILSTENPNRLINNVVSSNSLLDKEDYALLEE